jgi:hypothetical protein
LAGKVTIVNADVGFVTTVGRIRELIRAVSTSPTLLVTQSLGSGRVFSFAGRGILLPAKTLLGVDNKISNKDNIPTNFFINLSEYKKITNQYYYIAKYK